MTTDKKRIADLEADQQRMRDELHVNSVLQEARCKLKAWFDEYAGEIRHGFVEEHKDMSVIATVHDFVSYFHDELAGRNQ